MKKAKKGIEIRDWKVEGADAFAAITPEWPDELYLCWNRGSCCTECVRQRSTPNND
jgi:hypothetical protein